MSGCATAEVLEQLLRGTLAGPEREVVRSHLVRCEYCRAVLDELSGRTGLGPRGPEAGGHRESRGEGPRNVPDPPQGLAPTARGYTDATVEFEGGPAPGTSPDEAGGPGRLVGREVGVYRVEEHLGAGGMGEVYRARDTALGRDVALKVLPPGFSASGRARLLREAWAGARVQHPGLATFYDAGEAGGVDFIAMEYVPGRTLRAVLGNGPLPPGRAIAIAATVLEALAHAHAAGILHRDIKPENIMVTGERSAKLLDLGLAKGRLEGSPGGPASGGRPPIAISPGAPPTGRRRSTRRRSRQRWPPGRGA